MSQDSEHSQALQQSIDRRKVLLHVGLQIFALVTIFVLVNYMSCRHYSRWDLTQNSRFTLSPTTENFLQSLSEDIDLTVAFMAGSPVYDDLKTLVDQYKQNSNKKIDVEWVDPARTPDRATELQAKYGLSLSRNAVIVAKGDRVKVIPESRMVIRDGAGLVDKFAGEFAITAALLEVVEGQRRQIYLATGFQRAEYLQEVMQELQVIAARQNAQVNFLELSGGGSIPEDADAVILAAPQFDPPTAEMKEILDYWKGARGALFLALDPDAETPLLQSFVRMHGVVPRNDRIVFASQVPGQPLQKRYSVPTTMRVGSPIASERGLGGLTMTLGGRSQSIELHQEADFVKNENIHLSPVLVADPRFWGETDYEAEDIQRNRDLDTHAPIFLAATVERGAVDDPNLRVETQRMVIVSNPTILSGGLKRQKVQSDFVMASLNWLLDRAELIGVSAKEPTRYAIQLTRSQSAWLQRFVLWVFPGLVGVLGIFVWLQRRS
ncbi:MAG: GldG family protein [Verrucomicrobiota bacterium]